MAKTTKQERPLKEVSFTTSDSSPTRRDSTTEYIHWYNTERISTKLEGLSPVQYRAQALAA
jgi:transposase InsO family protein